MFGITAKIDGFDNDAFGITTEIDRFDMKRIPIDGGSSADILFLDAFEKWADTRRT